jgi:hypothetical protein
MAIGESHSLVSEMIDMGRVDLTAVTTKVSPTRIVQQDEHNVRHVFRRLGRASRRSKRRNTCEKGNREKSTTHDRSMVENETPQTPVNGQGPANEWGIDDVLITVVYTSGLREGLFHPPDHRSYATLLLRSIPVRNR